MVKKIVLLLCMLTMLVFSQQPVWHTLGIAGNAVFCMEPDGKGNVYAGCRAGIVKITGNTLQLISNSKLLENSTLKVHRRSGNIVVTNMFGLYVSTDEGATWSLPDTRLKFGPFPMEQFEDGVMIVATNKGNFISEDGGLRWDSVSAQNVGRIERGFYLSKSGRLFAGTAPGISASDDRGKTWTTLPGIINYTSDICENPVTGSVFVGVSYILSTSSSYRIYRSSDSGSSWSIMREQSGRTVDAIFGDTDGTLYAGSLEAIRSTDDGKTWEQFGTGLPAAVQINAFCRVGNTLYAGDLGKGIYAIDITPTGTDDNTALAGSYHLEQNFPNPFNPSTTISYTVPVQQHVRLSVYAANGEKITELINSVQEAGRHSTAWSAANLPSGIYVCRMQAGLFSASKKLILMK